MGSRLFVGNLPYSCTEGDIRSLFDSRWPVTGVRIVIDRETGQSRGFGFVELETERAAREAIEALDGHDLGGRRLAVREAHERQEAKPRRRTDERATVTVDTVTRRSGSFRDGARRGGGRFGTQRWEPPPDPADLDAWSSGATDATGETSRKKRDERGDW